MKKSLVIVLAVVALAGSATAASPPPAPPVPEFSACRTATKLVVTYRFATFPVGPRRPWLLSLSSKSAGDRYPPLTFRTENPKRSATIRQPLGLGKAPWRVLLSVRGVGGGRTATISRPLLPCR